MKINILIALVILTGCNKIDLNNAIILKAKTEFPVEKETSQEKTVINLNNEIVSLLKDKDYKNISKYIHPEKGIKLMYSFVSIMIKFFKS